jgi:DNA polymerase-1
MPETLYLIDAYAQIFRAYYAIRGGMRSPVTGEPTHAVFGFAGMLLKLLGQFHPHYVAVAVDAPGKTFRDELYGEYKGTRRATPEDLTAQIPRIFELVELFGIPLVSQPGLEADDVIACITRRILQDPPCADVQIRIVSKDKDLEQLLGDRVVMFDIHTDTTLDAAWLKETKGITPEQVVDVLALMGDSVDNVPGVEGIGPKTAAQLVQEFGSLDGILAHLDQIKGKRRENLEKARAHLPLSRQLVTLRCDAGFPFSLEAARIRPLQLPKILTLFQQLGFNRYQDEARRLAAGQNGRMGEWESGRVGEQTELPFADSPILPLDDDTLPPPLEDPWADHEEGAPAPAAVVETAASGDYRAITTRAELVELVETLRRQPVVSVDTETTSLEKRAALCGFSFAWQPGSGVYVPVRSPEAGQHLDPEAALALLKPLLEDEAVPKCGHNLKFDARALLQAGVKLRGVVFDSMLASALIDPTEPSHTLEHLAQSLLNYRMIPITGLIGSGEEQRRVDEVPLAEVVPYASEDADVALRLYEKLTPRLEAMGLWPLLREVEAPLAPVLAEMELNGILCDPEELRRQGEALRGRVTELREQIRAAAGIDFSPDSPKQLAEVLFEKLGLAPGRRTKTGLSTDIDVLERLAAQEDPNDPRTSVPRLVIEYRQLTKLISTYLGNLVAAIDPETGRIHSTFHQLVTATGRLASHNPNLQNIPVRTEIGRQIRKAFPAPPGHCLIGADYSQIELRLLAHCSQDAALLEAFRSNVDVHAAVAAQVFDTPLVAVTREQRENAKRINFGIIYGVTPYGLARRIRGLDVSTATQLIADYRQRFPGIDRFLQRCIQEAMDQGYVTTLMGRRRAIPEIYSTNRTVRSLGERLAINSVIQGSAADLIKAAMVNVQRRIDGDRLPLKLLLQIHDELVFETPQGAAEQQANTIRAEMERAMEISIPLEAEAGIGKDWLTCK